MELLVVFSPICNKFYRLVCRKEAIPAVIELIQSQAVVFTPGGFETGQPVPPSILEKLGYIVECDCGKCDTGYSYIKLPSGSPIISSE